MVSGRRVQPVQVAGAAGVEALAVVVQVERVEVGALAVAELLDPQHLAPVDGHRLARAGSITCSETSVLVALTTASSSAGRTRFEKLRMRLAEAPEPRHDHVGMRRSEPFRDETVEHLGLLLIDDHRYGLAHRPHLRSSVSPRLEAAAEPKTACWSRRRFGASASSAASDVPRGSGRGCRTCSRRPPSRPPRVARTRSGSRMNGRASAT